MKPTWKHHQPLLWDMDIKLKEKTYIESAIALGEMEVNLARSVDGGQNKVLETETNHGSFTYLFDPNVKNIVKDNNVNYYSD